MLQLCPTKLFVAKPIERYCSIAVYTTAGIYQVYQYNTQSVDPTRNMHTLSILNDAYE